MVNPNDTNASANNSTLNPLMTSMAECLSITQGMLGIPHFDGRNMPLKDFLQDIKNGAAYLPPESENKYVRGVLGKLQGCARDSTYGKTFHTVNDLIKHLKERFAQEKTASYYKHEIQNIGMKRGESVNDYYDRLNILISGASVVLQEQYGDNAEHVIKSISDDAIDYFIRGLPDELARDVDLQKPKTLEDARKMAARIETRMRAGILPSGSNSTFLRDTERPHQFRSISPNTRNPDPSDRSRPRSYSNYYISQDSEFRGRSYSPGDARPPPENYRSYDSRESYDRSYDYSPRSGPEYPCPDCQLCYRHRTRGRSPEPRQNYRQYNHGEFARNPANRNYRSVSPNSHPELNQMSNRSNPNDSASSRPRSPSPYSHKPTEDLNSNVSRRADANTGNTVAQRQPTVRFLEPVNGYYPASRLQKQQE